MNFVGRWEVAKQLLGGCTYSAGGKFYECLNAFVRVAKRTFRKVHEFWSKWFFRVFGHLEWNFLVLSKMPEDLTIELPL